MSLKRQINETQQYDRMMAFEREVLQAGFHWIAGIDEAGRGPLAGPVVAAACILDPRDPIFGINDSKKLTSARREHLYDEIARKALCWSVAQVEPEEIDQINILQATLKAMRLAVAGLSLQPEILLIDAVDLKGTPYPVRAIIKGDTLSVSIAAASILAKVTRDRLMDQFDTQYPGYGLLHHKGYGTPEHYAALNQLGMTPIHRRSFLKNLCEHS